MKKLVANVVVVVVASLYLMTKGLIQAYRQELSPYIGTVSLIQIAAFISASVVGFGLLGVFISVIK